MDSRRRGKRKSPSQDIIFEVSDNDISSENSEDDCNEPEAKISKLDGNSFVLQQNELSNLENNGETLSVEISVNQESENSIEISEHISVSNSSAGNSSQSGSDVIVISEDNIDVLNDSEEYHSAPREESFEHSEDKSVDSNEIIDITDENPVSLTEQGPESVTEENFVPVIDESPVCIIEDYNTLNKKKCNLEEGELDDSQTSIQVEELIDVTKSPSIEVDVQRIEDEVDATKSDQCMCVTFGSEKMAELYKHRFLKFLEQFVELEVKNSEGLTIQIERDTSLNPSEWVVLDETLCLNESKELDVPVQIALPLDVIQEKTPKKKKKKKNKKEKELFILDTNPSQNDNNTNFTKYSTKFQIDISEKTAVEDETLKVSAQTCFNCDSNHAIKDCPLPKDFARINAARQRFKAQKQTARYHLEEDQKYSHLKPGKISDKLREALGLRRNQLPPFVYHMRVLGYPPGWLEEAKFIHSDLAMFDSDGNNVRGVTKKNPGLDPEKIVDYPGFNSPMNNMKDEYRQYRVPPFSEKFSKKAMVEFFEKLYAKEQDDLEACDMELDPAYEEKEKNDTLEMGEETIVVNRVVNDLKEVDSSLPSPSLIDLEKEKENLLAALEENSSSNPKSVETPCDDPETSSDQDKSKNEQGVPEKLPLDETLEVDIDKTEDSSTSFASPSMNSSVNSVKTSTFGTPILKSSSRYSRLPNPDNFMKDVSPVINFENLPNSTGKYEQMTGVLQKVRSTLKGMQNCKS